MVISVLKFVGFRSDMGGDISISCEHEIQRLHNRVTGVCRLWPLLAAIRANKLNFDV